MSPTFFRAFNSLPLGARNNNNNSRNKNNTSKQRSTSIHVNPQTPLSPRQQQPSTERHGDARETSTKYREPRSRISMSSLKLRLKRATSSLKASLSRSPRPSSMSCHDGGILISATVVSPEPVVLLSFNIMVEETEDVDEENDVPVIESEEVRGDTNLFNGAVTAGATAVSDVTSTDVEPNPPFSPESLTSTSSSTSRIIICGEGNSERRLDYCSSEADTCCNNNVQHAIANGMDQRQQCRGTQKQQMQQQQQQQQQQQMQPQKRIEHRGLSHERRREEEAETENENENEGSKKAPLMPETIPTTTILTVECEGESEHQGRAVAGGTVDVEVVVGKSGHIHATTTIIATTRTTTITPATLFSTSTAKLHDNEEKEDKEGERDRLHHHHAELQYQQEKDKHTRQQHERDHHIHHHHHHQQSHLQPQEKGEEEDDVEDTGREYCPSIILHGKKKQRHSENVEDAEQETHGVHCPSSCYLLGPDLHTATSRTTTPSPFFFSQTPSPPPSPSTPPLAFARSRIPTEEYVPRRLFTENVTPPSPPPAAAPAVTMITHDDNRPRMQNPASRFEILERLGYGSSGSSVFKAQDKSDSMKTVAIKKIPLSTLTDNGRGDGSRDQGPTQADVDYFISCIADHNDYETEYEDGESEDEELSDGSSDSGAKYHQNESAMPNQPQRHRRSIRSSVINTMGGNGGLDQVVKCLGCYQTDTELWLSLEFCGGGSVADLIHLSDGPLIESEIGWIMSQILQGLAYLHSKGHVHGDIKAGNILLTVDGRVKLGGSGSVMNHKEGAGKRKRRRRSLTMSEFPASWLAPESNPSSPTSPSGVGAIDIINDHDNGVDSHSRHHSQTYFQWTPEASAETDVWALGVACIELSQGRPPRPEMPILALFGEQRLVGQQQASGNSVSFEGGYSGGIGNGNSTFAGWESVQTEPFGAAGMGMSEEMWSFIAKCLTPEPEARPSVHDLLQDPFIVQHSELSAELLTRILRMMDFIDQCATISSDTAPLINSSSSLALSLPPSTPASSSLTLSPLKALHMIDTKLDEASIGPWLIPMVLPRVDSVYDESSFFDDSGLPVPPPEPDAANHVSDWKHQRISHPVVKQALMCEQAGYMIFRHSRSPSLATIVESHLEEDTNSSNMDLGFELETELTDDFEEEEEDDEGDNELSVEYESEGSPFLGENGSRIPCEWLVA